MKFFPFKKWFKRIFFSNKEDLVQTNRNSGEPILEANHYAIGRMAAFFAHEIRNPLTSVIGFSQHLEQDPVVKANPHIANYISIIKDEAVRMEGLIQELLDLSKTTIDQDRLSIIDVKSSIEKVVTIYSMKPNYTGIQFKLDMEDEVYITGNPERFERVLINLIQNGIEALDGEGKIAIEVSTNNNHVVISVMDNGPGIPPEQLELIFYPFYTTKAEGTGIGLPICKAIIEAINGNMTIENCASRGTKVKMTIPQSQHTYKKIM